VKHPTKQKTKEPSRPPSHTSFFRTGTSKLLPPSPKPPPILAGSTACALPCHRLKLSFIDCTGTLYCLYFFLPRIVTPQSGIEVSGGGMRCSLSVNNIFFFGVARSDQLEGKVENEYSLICSSFFFFMFKGEVG